MIRLGAWTVVMEEGSGTRQGAIWSEPGRVFSRSGESPIPRTGADLRPDFGLECETENNGEYRVADKITQKWVSGHFSYRIKAIIELTPSVCGPKITNKIQITDEILAGGIHTPIPILSR